MKPTGEYIIPKRKGVIVKRIVIGILVILVFWFALHKQEDFETKATFNTNAKSAEEITEEALVAFLIEDITRDIQTFYAQYYSGEIAVYNYEISALEVAKEDTDVIVVKVGVTPQVGAHNPLGYDELSYAVDARGNISLKDYKHVKTYEVPEKFQKFWIKTGE